MAGVFARHPVACNLLMAMMVLAGVWALARLNVQFFPNFELDFVTVRVAWTGATAEDVETAITDVIEEELRTVDGLRKLTSRLVRSTHADRLAMRGMRRSRADLLPTGALILDTTAELLGLDGFTVCDWGLREGVLLETAWR